MVIYTRPHVHIHTTTIVVQEVESEVHQLWW